MVYEQKDEEKNVSYKFTNIKKNCVCEIVVVRYHTYINLVLQFIWLQKFKSIKFPIARRFKVYISLNLSSDSSRKIAWQSSYKSVHYSTVWNKTELQVDTFAVVSVNQIISTERTNKKQKEKKNTPKFLWALFDHINSLNFFYC